MKRKSKAFIAAFLSVCLIATTVLVSTGNAFASDANVGELAVTSAPVARHLVLIVYSVDY